MAEKAPYLVSSLRLDTKIRAKSVVHNLNNSQEIWDIKEVIGSGSFGEVRTHQKRRPAGARPLGAHEIRAVKELRKVVDFGRRWDYMTELEVIVRFSQPCYAPFFVRTQGWFENAESVFITMEYFPLGDLRRSMATKPPFSERPASLIVRQLVQGIGFMHDSGFAHRDLKPENILVASRSPRWLVKIADFGICKQALGGGTWTVDRGTFRYMAPEAMDRYRDGSIANKSSLAVDIWAIGSIAAEILLKRLPFTDDMALYSYVLCGTPLNLDGVAGVELSDVCREFITSLLAPKPENRPIAAAALAHPWLADRGNAADEDDSMFVENEPQASFSLPQEAGTLASSPSIAWTTPAETLLSTYQGPGFDTSTLVPSFRTISISTTRYFILRSDNAIDIESSVAHGVWTSSQRVNKILEKGYRRTNGEVILFFSVINSSKFCGVARMTSTLDWGNTDEHWVDDSWQGRFTLDWICLTELPFEGHRHLRVKEDKPGFRAFRCFDGTEMDPPSAYELLKAFSEVARVAEQTQLAAPLMST